jgi:Na+-driven multidrug efflux pump
MDNDANKRNFLETEKISDLLPKFAIPAIISGLITATYNIVDQIFIGNSVGMLGNAATNIAFPVVLVCTAVSIMSGVAARQASTWRWVKGTVTKPEDRRQLHHVHCRHWGSIAAVTLIFLNPLLNVFGATKNIFHLHRRICLSLPGRSRFQYSALAAA